MALVLDTVPLYASLDRRDANYIVCRRLLEETTEPLVIPAPVLVEVDCWIHLRLHPGGLVALLDDIIAGACRVEELYPEDYTRVRELCDRYADADVGFLDAAVLAIVERLNEPKLATLDHRHFQVLRPRQSMRSSWSQISDKKPRGAGPQLHGYHCTNMGITTWT